MKKYAPFFVLCAGILWGTIGIYVKKLNNTGLNSMDIVAIRAALTAFALFLCLLIYKRQLLVIRIRDIWCFVGTGVFSIVFFNYCYFRAMTLIPLSIAAILLYTAPAFVLLMSAVLFKEKITKRKMAALILTMLGCALASGITGSTGSVSFIGIVYGLGAGLGYALYSIFGRYAINRGYSSMTISFYTFLCAAAASVPFADAGKIISIGVNDYKMLGFYIIFAIMSTVLPYILYTSGLLGMENSKASVIASIEPVAAAVIGFLVFKEALSAQQIIGVALVIGAIAFANMHKNSTMRRFSD